MPRRDRPVLSAANRGEQRYARWEPGHLGHSGEKEFLDQREADVPVLGGVGIVESGVCHHACDRAGAAVAAQRPRVEAGVAVEHQFPGWEMAGEPAEQRDEVVLIDTYRPSVLWNDMGWPAESNPQELFAHYYDTVADGVVNDRWTQVKLPVNRIVRELYLRWVALAFKAMSRLGRPLPTQPRRSSTTSGPMSTPPPTRHPPRPGSSPGAWAAPSATTPRSPSPTP